MQDGAKLWSSQKEAPKDTFIKYLKLKDYWYSMSSKTIKKATQLPLGIMRAMKIWKQTTSYTNIN